MSTSKFFFPPINLSFSEGRSQQKTKKGKGKIIFPSLHSAKGFPGGSVVAPANAGEVGSIRTLGRSPGEGNGNLLQYSCLGNPMDRGAWWAAVHGVTNELDTTQ